MKKFRRMFLLAAAVMVIAFVLPLSFAGCTGGNAGIASEGAQGDPPLSEELPGSGPSGPAGTSDGRRPERNI